MNGLAYRCGEGEDIAQIALECAFISILGPPDMGAMRYPEDVVVIDDIHI